MKAVVMAGGVGSRLHPLTLSYPKAMIPVVNQPVLAHVLRLLKQHHFSEVIITVRWLAEYIQAYFGDGHHLGMSLHYVVEPVPLGTAGSIKNAEPYLDGEPCLVISGDIVTNIDLSSLWRFHQEKKALMTLALTRVTDPREYGVVVTDQTGRIQQYAEKPSTSQAGQAVINAGIYVLQPELLADLEPNRPLDFSRDVFPHLLRRNAPLFGYQARGYWRDMGTIPSYLQTITDLLTGQVKQVKLGRRIGPHIWVGQDVEIGTDVSLRGPIYLGHRVKIKRGVTICGPVVIGDGTVVDQQARIERSIIGSGSFIGRRVEVRHEITLPGHSFLTSSPAGEDVTRRRLNREPHFELARP